MNQETQAPRSELDEYLASQALLLQPTSAEACTDLGAEQQTPAESADPKSMAGILIGATLGLTAWSILVLALLAAHLP